MRMFLIVSSYEAREAEVANVLAAPTPSISPALDASVGLVE
jgi:hypothetical protein